MELKDFKEFFTNTVKKVGIDIVGDTEQIAKELYDKMIIISKQRLRGRDKFVKFYNCIYAYFNFDKSGKWKDFAPILTQLLYLRFFSSVTSDKFFSWFLDQFAKKFSFKKEIPKPEDDSSEES